MTNLQTNLTGSTPQGTPTSPTHSAMHNQLHLGIRILVAANDASNEEKARAFYVCDGTDDDVQIQAAIDSLSGIIEVWLSTGTFIIGSSIIMKNCTSLIGSGRSSTFLYAKNNLNAAVITSQTAGTTQWYRGRVAHLRIDGNKANQSGTAYGIIMDAQESVIEDCFVDACKTVGIWYVRRTAATTFNNKIIDCVIKNCAGKGVLMDSAGAGGSADDVMMIGCEIYDHTGNGVEVLGAGMMMLSCHVYGCAKGVVVNSVKNVFVGNHVETNTGEGFHFNSGGDNNTIIANLVWGNGTGVKFDSGANDNAFSGNTVISNTTDISNAGTNNYTAQPFEDITIDKSSAQSVNNSTTLVDDTRLQKALPVGTYAFEIWAMIRQGNAAAGFKFNITPVSSSNHYTAYNWHLSGYNAARTENSGMDVFDGAPTDQSFTLTNNATAFLKLEGIIYVSTAMTWAFRWAQLSAQAVNTQIIAGWLKLKRIY